jgi:hypothetical protein
MRAQSVQGPDITIYITKSDQILPTLDFNHRARRQFFEGRQFRPRHKYKYAFECPNAKIEL